MKLIAAAVTMHRDTPLHQQSLLHWMLFAPYHCRLDTEAWGQLMISCFNTTFQTSFSPPLHWAAAIIHHCAYLSFIQKDESHILITTPSYICSIARPAFGLGTAAATRTRIAGGDTHTVHEPNNKHASLCGAAAPVHLKHSLHVSVTGSQAAAKSRAGNTDRVKFTWREVTWSERDQSGNPSQCEGEQAIFSTSWFP